ncbi:MAG: TonB-dependent receptor [Bdellovibrio sp.]|nr:TonB-dependent receptor [Methylotenera sp.]
MNKTTIASLVALAFTSPALTQTVVAAEQINLDEVTVTASRFNESSASSAANLKVITKEDIQNSPAISIPDLLRLQAGLNITSLYGNQGIDATIDARGFGDSATSNTLILLNGQRLNAVDGGSIQWASIPLDSIERIEIIIGGGSVLYGDRATGGVINLITDKSGKSAASITASAGSYGYKSLDGFAAGGIDHLYFNNYIHTADTNGWKDNAASNQWAISGRVGGHFNAGEAFVDYSVYRSANGLPGSISSDSFQNNPRFARTPFDSQVKEGFRIMPGVSVKLSDTIELATELSYTQGDQHFNNVSFGATSDRDTETYSFTPRVKWAHGLGALNSTTVAGYDYYRGKVAANYHAGYANAQAKQSSNAFYLQNNTALTSAIDINVGFRTHQAHQTANQEAYAPFGMTAVAGDVTRRKTVYDLGLTYHETNWNAYAKTGSSYRFANTDEFFGFDPITFEPIFLGKIILPQTANNQEIGATFKQGQLDGKIALYHSSLKNEIGYDAATGNNVNFDPTRRQGVEAELGWEILSKLKTKLSYAYTDAAFKSGTFNGKSLPSVASNSAHAQVLWNAQQYGQYVAQVNFVGERYTSGDFSNSLNKLPSYTTLDLRANWNIKPVTISLSALNVTDKKYSPYGLYSTFKNDYYYFPADGRSFYLSARYDFK